MKTRESLPAFYSDPQIRHLPQLLEEIERGQILIPRFQRPLVWPKDKRLALLDSILESIPIGTVMLWRTRLDKVAVKDRLGPFKLPVPDADAPVRQYLLDGEQRLTTLFFALIGARKDGEDSDEPSDAFRVFYDLREKKFKTRDDLSLVLPHHLPLTDLLQGPALVKFQRNLFAQYRAEQAGDDSYADADTLVDLSDEVADAFRQYKLPTVPVTSDDVELVTRTFKRVNSQHVTMSEVHMVNALAWSSSFDLSERLQRMREGVLAEQGWDELDDQTILRVCKVALDMAVYDDNAEAVGDALKKNPRILSKVESDLGGVARFLKKYAGIRIPGLVPYTAQIVLLAAAVRGAKARDEEVDHRLRDWLWFTTYTETFQRQMSDSRFSQLLNEVWAIASGKRLIPPHGKQPSRRRLPRFDFRHARARGIALLMARQKPRDTTTPSKEASLSHGSRLLAEYRTRGMAQIVTSTMARKPAISSSPGARVLIRPESIGLMRKLLQSADPPPDGFLESHIISHDAWQAFREGDYETFVKLREDDLNRMEDKRFQAIVQRLYPDLAAT